MISNIIPILKTLDKTAEPTMLDAYKDRSPFELLVMTLLSARTKDATVIPIALKLYKTHNKPEHFVSMQNDILAKKLYGIGFHNTKAKHIIKLSKILIDKYNGEVPRTMHELVELPGVGRKTANCILSYCFNVPAIAVDTHVHRICNKERLNWINTKTVEDTERELMRVVPKRLWVEVNRLIVDHGQRVCAPIKPKCQQCSITAYCATFDDNR